MDLEAMRGSPLGQLVPISGLDERLQEYSHFAFLPSPLPDEIVLSGVTWSHVVEASTALGRLQQACSTLPNPRLLIAPALAREAVDTSALEGTYGALADVLEARMSDERPEKREVAEIRAYERIAHLAFRWVADGRPVTVALLSDLQGILAEEAVEPQLDPGRVRQHQVVIGPKGCSVYEARYVPPPPDDRLRAGLDQWEGWIGSPHPALPPVLAAALGHYQFEALHPFGDGNGRLGRLTILLQLLTSGALSEPAITISPWLRKHRDAYQGHLLRISQTGDWSPWVGFFCQAMGTQSLAAVDVVESLNEWLLGVRQELNERHWSGVIANVVEDLVNWPVITSPWVQTKYGVSAPTAKSAIDRLVALGVLEETEERRHPRVYRAKAVIRAVDSL